MLGDAVAEREQTVGKVDILGEDLAADVQLRIGEIPDPAHAERNELLGDLLRDMLGHGQYRNIGMARGEIVADLVERADKHVVDARANERGGDVERGVEQKTGLHEVKVAQQRVAQVAGADDDEAVLLIHAENVTDLGAQLQNVVAVALLAEFTEAAEILPDLRGGDVHFLPQRIGGNAYHALVMQLVQIAVIAGQTMDHRIRDLLFFHMRPSSLPAAGAGLQPAFPHRLFSSF